jgi:hypothetical protein
MEVRNRDGDPVDPVPFFVSAGLAAMLLLSCGPLYGLAYGVSVQVSLWVAGVCTAVITGVAYHRLVWTATPRWIDVPAQFRFERLLYIGVAFGLVLIGLSLPLLF